MSKVSNSFFGGSEKSAADAAVRGQRFAGQEVQFARQLGTRNIKEQLRRARTDIRTGERRAIGEVRGGISQARADISAGVSGARADISAGASEAIDLLDPFRTGGQRAFEEQQALLGLSGEEEGAAALSRFQESPGQEFLRQEQEQAILRNAAATGGTQGGKVLTELQRQAFGRAQTDFGNQFSRLQQLGVQGQQAAGGIGNILTDEAAQLAQFTTGGAQNLARLAEARGSNIANLRTGSAQAQAQLRQAQGLGAANVAIGAGTQLQQIQQNIGAAQAAGISGQAAAFRSGLRETVSLASGQGGFGAPGISDVLSQFQQGASVFGSFVGGGGGSIAA